ncbi:serine/threonine protein kinase [Kamptonema formosum]|uniref:serine/threonine protein kinase n=1 Tax=Kamptonema formosum TaxID=331992 RepID=UPI00034D5927|nr:protein kinase [Oscillatoria sp. PCC 10802]
MQDIKHPRLISCLEFFETKQGFCLVRDYKKAPSLAEIHSLPPERIKPIIMSILEILADMQKRVPPFIHGNIKPENVLIDYDLNAYLVDWGLDRIGGGKATGIPGFMPPEQQFNPSPSLTSDLYSLGATLICLLTGTSSADIGKFVDSSYRLNFKGLLPQLNPRFISWL